MSTDAVRAALAELVAATNPDGETSVADWRKAWAAARAALSEPAPAPAVDERTADSGHLAAASNGSPGGAVVYPPDGTVSPFTVINLGSGAVRMGDAIHDGRLPALWFGTGGEGMGHEAAMNRAAHDGETIAVVTFANVDGLDVLLDVIERCRRVAFPGAPARSAATSPEADGQMKKD